MELESLVQQFFKTALAGVWASANGMKTNAATERNKLVAQPMISDSSHLRIRSCPVYRQCRPEFVKENRISNGFKAG